MTGEYCAYCGEEIITKHLTLVECFGCGNILPCCMSERCIDQMDCSNCLNGVEYKMEEKLKDIIQPQIYIILKNHNAFKYTKECIESLNQTSYPNKKIIVVDDNSEVNELNKLNSLPCDVIGLDKYSDFCKCFNIGIKHAIDNNADYIMIVNNDTKDFSINFFEEMLKVFKYDKMIGMVGSRVYNYNNDIRWTTTPPIKFGISMDVPTDGYILKTDMLKQVGGFDEGLYRFFEDLDLIVRLRTWGWKTGFADNVSFCHLGGASSNKKLYHKYYHRSRNVIWFVNQYCKKDSIIIQAKRIIIALIPNFQAILYNNDRIKILKATIKGVQDGFRTKWVRNVKNFNN